MKLTKICLLFFLFFNYYSFPAFAQDDVIDVMLVYDTSAKSWVDRNCGMETFSYDILNKMNIVLLNSGLADVRFNLVHAVALPYTNSDFSTSLEDLTNSSGGLSSVGSLRNEYGADLVAMLVDTGSASGVVGLGYLLSTYDGMPDNAFTVSAIQSVDISHTLTHEIGHNLGAHHSKYQYDSPGPNVSLNTYSAGWYFYGSDNEPYHTIMAYNYDGYGNYYNAAPVFSSPLISYLDNVAGHSEDGDNARTIRETKGVVSNYRISSQSDISLDEAVDNPDYSWTTEGDSFWFGQSGIFFNGGDAAQSGNIGDGQSTSIFSSVLGPATLSFYWKVSSELDYDSIAFYIDNIQQVRMSGISDWNNEQYIIPSGEHTIRWTYSKDSSVSSGSDCGWVDSIVISRSSPLSSVSLYNNPSSPRVAGTAITFTAVPTGGANVQYQFRLRDLNGTWSDVRTYSGSAIWEWDTSAFAPGTYRIAVWAKEADSLSVYDQYAYVDFTLLAGSPVITLGEAVDLPGSTWTTGGSSAWFGQTSTFVNDGDAAQSGDVVDNQISYMQTTVVGPANLNFYWKVYSEINYDFISFYIDDILQVRMSGISDWNNEQFTIPSGEHTIRWTYSKDSSVSTGSDCGWVDSVVINKFDPLNAVSLSPESVSPSPALRVSPF